MIHPRSIILIYDPSPEYNADEDDLESLSEDNPAPEYSDTDIWVGGVRLLHHFLQEVRVIVDQKWADGAAQEEVKAHAEVEDGVQVFSFPDFPYKGAVHSQIQGNKKPFE